MNIEQIIMELFRIRTTHQRNALNHIKAERLDDIIGEATMAAHITSALSALSLVLQQEKMNRQCEEFAQKYKSP